jgi:hypothetical protein
VNTSGLGYVQTAGSCECDNEPLSSVNVVNFLTSLVTVFQEGLCFVDLVGRSVSRSAAISVLSSFLYFL